MMPLLQRLKHGKALCQNAFGGFVETFNHLVSFRENMKGDGDGNGRGHIRVDNTNPDFPVIRCDGCQSDDSAPAATATAFNVVSEGGSTLVKNCVFTSFGVRRTLPDFAAPTDGTVYLRMSRYASESDNGEDWTFDMGTSQIANVAGERQAVNIPIYLFANGKVSVDYRTAFPAFEAPARPDNESLEYAVHPATGENAPRLQLKGIGNDDNVGKVPFLSGRGHMEWRNVVSAWTLVDGKWHNAFVICGNRTLSFGSGWPDALVGENYVLVDIGDMSLEIVNEEQDNTDSVKCIYVGKVEEDDPPEDDPDAEPTLVQTEGIYTAPVVVCYE